MVDFVFDKSSSSLFKFSTFLTQGLQRKESGLEKILGKVELLRQSFNKVSATS